MTSGLTKMGDCGTHIQVLLLPVSRGLPRSLELLLPSSSFPDLNRDSCSLMGPPLHPDWARLKGSGTVVGGSLGTHTLSVQGHGA